MQYANQREKNFYAIMPVETLNMGRCGNLSDWK